jgi:hypothetical protein
MIKNPMSDTKIVSEKMTGFYRGVVEDNNDPLKAGRVRARIWGLHTSQKIQDELKGIPTDQLPWAEPCFGLTEGSVSGFGMWSLPLQGSHIMLFFENGNLSQPRYFATMPGIPESKASLDANDPKLHEVQAIGSVPDDSPDRQGFQDPDGVYPTDVRLGEPDVHRLARGISDGTLVQTQDANRDLGVPEALGGSWDEPQSPYATQYPHNLVIATHGGLTLELDSTPGAARLNFYHPSNSFIQIDNDGVMVIKNNDKRYEIILSDNNIHIKRDRSLTIDNDSKKFVKGNESEETTGNKVIQIDGNVEETIGGDVEGTIGGDLNITVTGPVTVTAPTVTVNSPATTVTGGTVSLGSQATMRKLMNELMIALYNAHQHTYHDTSSGAGFQPTTPPINNTLSLAQATDNVEAS